jgi:tetratricopeptide (TPR) repeat protein
MIGARTESGNSMREGAPDPADARPRRAGAGLWLAVIPLLAAAAYMPALQNDWVYCDDVLYVLENPAVTEADRFWENWSGARELSQYYPLTFSSYWLEYRLWGHWPTGYVLTNLVLHAVNALLVYALARAAGAGMLAAWLAAALFAIHPIQVSSVAWIAQRKNTLSGLLALLSALLYLRSLRELPETTGLGTARLGSGSASYAGSIALFAAALLAKTQVLTIPASLALYEWIVLGRRDWGILRRTGPFFALGLLGAGITVVFEQMGATLAHDLPLRPLAASAALLAYLGNILMPIDLRPVYPHWEIELANPLWWVPLPAVLLIGWVLWSWRERIGLLSTWAMAHFLVTLLPVLGLVSAGYLFLTPVANHLAYLAAIGPFLMSGLAVEDAWQRSRGPALRTLIATLSAAALVALGLGTWQQTAVFRDAVRYWEVAAGANLALTPAQLLLGRAYLRAGRYDDAERCYRSVLERIESPPAEPTYFDRLVRLAPELGVQIQADALTGLGAVHLEHGRLDEARRTLVAAFRGRESLADAPADPENVYYLGLTELRAGNTAQALAYLADLTGAKPDYAEARLALGIALSQRGQLREATEHVRRAAWLRPDLLDAQQWLGDLLARQGALEEARAAFRRALRLAHQKGDHRLVQEIDQSLRRIELKKQ